MGPPSGFSSWHHLGHLDEIFDAIVRSGHMRRLPRGGECIEHLAELGHRRFLHLAGDYAHTSVRRRRDDYLATIERLGLGSHGVIDCHWHAEQARQAVLDLPTSSGVTAVIAASDPLAAGAISGAARRGWRVPQQLSVTGWDNGAVGPAMAPALSTVEVDHETLGRRAVSELVAAVHGTEQHSQQSQITKIIWRDSTGPSPDRKSSRTMESVVVDVAESAGAPAMELEIPLIAAVPG